MILDVSNENYLGLFTKAYVRSNILFPQTRFYFIIEFCTRLSHKQLLDISKNELTFENDSHLLQFVELAKRHHKNWGLEREISNHHITNDIKKMLIALSEFFNRFSGDIPITITTSFKLYQQLFNLKSWIDLSNLSVEYLNFLTGYRTSGCEGKTYAVRMQNTLASLLLSAPQSDVLDALWPEINKQVWVLRKN